MGLAEDAAGMPDAARSMKPLKRTGSADLDVERAESLWVVARYTDTVAAMNTLDGESPFPDRLQAHLHAMSTTAVLIRAAAVISAYELLKPAIVNRLVDFFSDDLDGRTSSSRSRSDEFRDAVMRFAPGNEMLAACRWHHNMNVLDEEDLAAMDALWAERNRMAHELPTLMLDPDQQVDVSVLDRATSVARKVDVFWALTHADADPRFDGVEIDPASAGSAHAELVERLKLLTALADQFTLMADVEQSFPESD